MKKTLVITMLVLLSGLSSGVTVSGVKPEIRERLGHELPPDLIFRDERGSTTALRTIIDRPAIISLVYFRCGHACPVLLGSLAGALGRIEADPAKDYRVITISFDDADKSEVAMEKKINYIMAVGKPFPEDSWRFLTGDETNIRKLTEALGFEFKREANGFIHPNGLIFLSADGRVRRYLYGTSFSPFDIKMALAESSHGRGTLSGGSVLLFSFSYDRVENTYHFNIVKVFGIISLFFVSSLFFFSRMARKKSLGEGTG